MPVLTERQQRRRKNDRAFKRERKRIGVIKGTKPVRDPEYLAWIRMQWCIICEYVTGSEAGTRHVEAAHVGRRGLGQKCSDNETVPLCVRHHRTGKDSHHVLGKNFWKHHGLDRDQMVRRLINLYMAERAS